MYTITNFLAMLVIATSAFALSDQTQDSHLSRSRLRNIARHRAQAHSLVERQSATNGYVYAGCVTDGPARALTGSNTWTTSMTVDDCLTTCAAGGFTYAGLQSKSSPFHTGSGTDYQMAINVSFVL